MESPFKVELIPPLTKEQEVERYNATHEDSKMSVQYFDIEEFKKMFGEIFYGRSRKVTLIAGAYAYNYSKRMYKNFRLYHRLKRNYGKR